MNPNHSQKCNSFDLNARIPRLKKQIPRIPKKSNSEGKKEVGVYKVKEDEWAKVQVKRSILLQKRNKPSLFLPESRVSVISEDPFVIKVNTRGIPIRSLDGSKLRSSGRSGKRKSYTEKETDSDFLETDSEDDAQPRKKTKRLSKGVKKNPQVAVAVAPFISKVDEGQKNSHNPISKGDEAFANYEPLPAGNHNIEAPPPGVLSSLWYSREGVFQNVWVIEKILGWKTRSKFEIKYKDESLKLNKVTAGRIQDKLINHYISNGGRRMDVSRISPRNCPEVLKAWVEKEEQAAKKQGGVPRFYADKAKCEGREEVLLIKWRGRSHLHCSWERHIDLERLDPTNNTAKGKIKRYYQMQHSALGADWKNTLIDGRKAASSDHGHGIQVIQSGDSVLHDHDDFSDHDEFYSPDNLEVERIIACDENDMDVDLFAKQRALNMRNEKDREECRQEELLGSVHHMSKPSLDNVDEDKEEPWDPEDYVRYVVKWKGSSFLLTTLISIIPLSVTMYL